MEHLYNNGPTTKALTQYNECFPRLLVGGEEDVAYCNSISREDHVLMCRHVDLISYCGQSDVLVPRK